MDDKMMDILVANGIATGKCVDGMERLHKAIQKLVNKVGRQTVLNLIGGFFLYLCVTNIGSAFIKIEKLEKRVAELEARGEAPKK